MNVSPGNLRSPKSLTELCIDALCRSLPYLDGELPSGLPQDVVDDVICSLTQHSALTATTLRVFLRHCELGSLSLAGCRGVTDAWLEPLSRRISSSSSSDSTNSSSATSSPAAVSPVMTAAAVARGVDNDDDDDAILSDTMNLDEEEDSERQQVGIDHDAQVHANAPSDIFYGTFDTHKVVLDTNENENASLCSMSSFVSATEDIDHHNHHRQPMDFVVTEATTATATITPLQDTKPLHTTTTPTITTTTTTAFASSSVTTNLTLLDIRGSQGLTDRGLMQLTNLSRLQVAKLDNCHSLTGRGLLAFCHSHRLHSLSLANCRRLTDEAVINISHLQSLEALSLDGCRCLTDRSLAALSDLYALTKLDLSQCDLITDRGLEQLKHLALLEELSLGWCRLISDAGLLLLTGHTGRAQTLRVLRLARCTITDAGVGHLARLQALEELDLNGCASIGSAALGNTLEKLKRLTDLDVSHCPGIM